MKNKIKKILSEVMGKNIEELPGNFDIINDAGLDSLQMINFILGIEHEFDVEFDFDMFDYSHLKSIDIFCQFILKQKG